MTLHTTLSYIKSLIRMIGFVALGFGHYDYAATLLLIAEMVGIWEEVPGSYAGTQMEEPKSKNMMMAPLPAGMEDTPEVRRRLQAVVEGKLTNSRGPM